MSLYHSIVFSIKTGLSLILDQIGDLIKANMTVYQRLIEKLIYLGCGTWLGIAFVIGQLSCHNSDPQASYLHIAKQVLWYLKRTSTVEIVWGKDLVDNRKKYKSYRIIGYADSSYARDIND